MKYSALVLADGNEIKAVYDWSLDLSERALIVIRQSLLTPYREGFLACRFSSLWIDKVFCIRF